MKRLRRRLRGLSGLLTAAIHCGIVSGMNDSDFLTVEVVTDVRWRDGRLEVRRSRVKLLRGGIDLGWWGVSDG